MENFKDFKFTFLLTVGICLLALIPFIGPMLIIGGFSIFFIFLILNPVFADREIPEINQTSEPLFDYDDPYQLIYYEPTSIEAENIYQVKDFLEIILSPKKIDPELDITSYIKAISKIRHLEVDKELHLPRKVADLIQLEKLASQYESEKGHFPSYKEWAEITDMPLSKFRKRLLLGRRAREIIVQHNLNLVVSIAKKYINRGLSFPELIQIGALGLKSAAEKFEDAKGYRFSTFSMWWIRQAITGAIADQSVTFSSIITNVEKEYSRLRDFKEDDIDILRQDLEKVMAPLSQRERDVLEMLYGLDGGSIHSFEEIGKIFKVTGERIRQIERKALSKLRNRNTNIEVQSSIPDTITYKFQKEKKGISEADELKKYSELKNQGIITEEEFNAKKKQILGL